MDPRELKNAYARVDENKRYIAWVWRSLKYRMTAYAYAIKKLEIETPSPRVQEANQALRFLLADFEEQNGTIANSDSQGDWPTRLCPRATHVASGTKWIAP